jgi:Tol biopolymer transport system component
MSGLGAGVAGGDFRSAAFAAGACGCRGQTSIVVRLRNPVLQKIAACSITLLASLAPVPQSAAGSPPGPRLATVELIQTKGSEREEKASSPFSAVTTFGSDGGKKRHLLKGKLGESKGVTPFFFYGPTWTGDGSAIAFLAAKGEGVSFYAIDADGGQLQRLRGVIGPVFSPDGHWMAFSRTRSHDPVQVKALVGQYESTSTWLWDLRNRELRQLTRWRDGLSNQPTSFSPDGSLLALTRTDDRVEGQQIVLAHLDGSGSTALFDQASEAVISPDGTRIAFAGYRNSTHIEAEENRDYDIGELYVANIDGTHVQRVTHNATKIESSPGWDPSGERLAYVQVEADTSFVPGLALLFPFGNEIREMNADGSCKTTVSGSPKLAFYGVAWQPGVERGAGRIEC